MSGVNVHVSVNNLPQIDRHQNDMHKNPIVNQDQNSKIAQNELSKKLSIVVEAESTQGKTINKNLKKDDLLKKNKSNKKKAAEKTKEKNNNDEGFIVDVNA